MEFLGTFSMALSCGLSLAVSSDGFSSALEGMPIYYFLRCYDGHQENIDQDER